MKLENNWKYKSLAHLQKLGNYSPSKNPPTPLVAKCEALFLKPFNEYSIENLRIMIGQDIGLEFLVPLAIEKLQEYILAEGDFYPGDLLQSVLRVNRSFWLQHRVLYDQLKKLVKASKQRILKEEISLGLFKQNLKDLGDK
jgi:hypothetical protein